MNCHKIFDLRVDDPIACVYCKAIRDIRIATDEHYDYQMEDYSDESDGD